MRGAWIRAVRVVLAGAVGAAFACGGSGSTTTRSQPDSSATGAPATGAPATGAPRGAPSADTARAAARAGGVTASGLPFAPPAKPLLATPIAVTSSTFTAGGTLPASTEFNGCGGGNTSPELSWSGVPPNTKSFVLTLFDPDAPTGTGFWHWVVFNIPSTVTRLPAGAGSKASPVPHARSGYTDFGFSHYGGPCPPPGDPPHHYIFTLYALDLPAIEGVGPSSTAADIMFALRGHLLAQGSLEGRFGR